jgi:hypothetical protein
MELSNVDIRVTPALHPDNVKNLDGFDGQTAPYVAPTQTAFSEAYEGIRAVHNAREKARKNPTWNEAMQIIQTDILAQKLSARITRIFDSTRENLNKGIIELERQLSAPIEAKASGSIAGEVRAHAKNLTNEQRSNFIRRAIEETDHVTVSCILGAPGYLSGLDDKAHKIYTRMWHEHNTPDVAKRLKVMKGARQMIEDKAGLTFIELEKAVGATSHKAKALREAKTDAEKAFILQDD